MAITQWITSLRIVLLERSFEKDNNGLEVEIKAKSIYQPRKNLGHYKAPAGDANVQYQQLKQKAMELLTDIIAAGGTREDSRMLIETVRTPAVTYTVGQSYIGDTRLDEINKVTMGRMIAASGYDRNMAQKIAQALIELGGAGFVPLKVNAYYSYIMNFLKHWNTPDEEIGKVLRIVYAWAMETTGVLFLILNSPKIHIRSEEHTV